MTEININPESELGFLLGKIAERLERIAIGIEKINQKPYYDLGLLSDK